MGAQVIGRFLGLIVMGGIFLTASSGWAEDMLERYRWQDRLVVTFAAAAPSKPATAQRAEQTVLPAEWQDRDLVLIHVAADNRVTVDGKADDHLEGSALRQRYGIDNGRFTALLIGKDGGVKVRSGDILENGDLFATIDAMPMRQSEMGRNN